MFPRANTAFKVTIGKENFEEIKQNVAVKIMDIMPQMMRNTEDYMQACSRNVYSQTTCRHPSKKLHAGAHLKNCMQAPFYKLHAGTSL